MSDAPLAGIRVAAFAPRVWPVWGAGSQRTEAYLTGFARAGAAVTAVVPRPHRSTNRSRSEALTALDVRVVGDPLAWLPWQVAHAAMCAGIEDRFVLVHRRAQRTLASSGVFDVVFASGAPFSAVMAAARFARRNRLPLFVDLRDEWAENPFARTGPLHRRLARARERNALQNASVLTAPFPAVLTLARAPIPGTVIPHGCDARLVADNVGPPARMPPGGPLVLCFAGARYGRINESAFLRACARIRLPGAVELRLVGSERAVAEPLPHRVEVAVVPPLDHSALMAEYDRAHALLVLAPPSRGPEWVPSKLPEYWATGRPVLGFVDRNSVVGSTVAAEPGGITVPEDDPVALGRAFRDLFELAQAAHDYRHDRVLRTWHDVGDEVAALLAAHLRCS